MRVWPESSDWHIDISAKNPDNDKNMYKDIEDYIKKQRSPQREICQKIRKIIFKAFPGIEEEMKWGVPVFAGGKFYIGALEGHVNLGFSVKGLTKKESALFSGKGKTMRHIKIEKFEDIDEKRLMKLLRMVHKKARCEKVC